MLFQLRELDGSCMPLSTTHETISNDLRASSRPTHAESHPSRERNAFQAHQLEPFQGLLRRLARYGDRAHIVIDERLRALVPIDSSVFNLVLARAVD
jgi:hypothetical protein